MRKYTRENLSDLIVEMIKKAIAEVGLLNDDLEMPVRDLMAVRLEEFLKAEESQQHAIYEICWENLLFGEPPPIGTGDEALLDAAHGAMYEIFCNRLELVLKGEI